MNFKQKRKRINEIAPGAWRIKLGELLPEVIKVTLVAGDISSGTASIDIGDVGGEICSVLVKSSAGAIRAVTSFTHTSGTYAVTATNIAAGDTVTMMFI